MNILTIVYSIGLGGTERAAVNFAVGYKRAGEGSRVLVLGKGYDRLEALQNENIEVDLLELANNKEPTLLKIKNWRPDIIHIHNFTKELLPFIESVKHENTKVVETNVFSRPNYSDSYQVVNLSMQLSKWGYFKFNKWMSNYKKTPQTAVVPYPVLCEAFCVNDQFKSFEFRIKHKIPETAFVVGRIGQPHFSKWDMRIVYVIEKILATKKDIYFVLVGLPHNIEERLIKKMGENHPKIKILPIIQTDAELAKFYSSIDCFAHISKIGESFGYVLAEAMLFNVPVVTMLTPLRDNAQFEMIGHNFGGKCAVNSSQFVNSILEMYSDKELYKNIRKNLFGYVEERFGLKAIAKIQLPLYYKLLENKVIENEDYSQLISNVFHLYGLKKYILKPLFYLIHTPFITRNYRRIFYLTKNL